YSAYRAKLDEEKRAPKAIAKMVEADAETQAPKKKDNKKLSFKDKYELEQLEKDLPALGKERVEIEKALQDASLAYEEIERLSKRITEVVAELEEKELRWLELDELRG
ncbi:MAG TPA: ABC transporter, partial [Flavobacteriales bacterium]|nr:ABC transporter [Flavobacteriales bacterium]